MIESKINMNKSRWDRTIGREMWGMRYDMLVL